MGLCDLKLTIHGKCTTNQMQKTWKSHMCGRAPLKAMRKVTVHSQKKYTEDFYLFEVE